MAPTVLNAEPLFDFNAFVRYGARKGISINGCRARFHAFCFPEGKGCPMPMLWWGQRWDAFCGSEDARDERETMLDARYA
jgi:hypothetical protein